MEGTVASGKSEASPADVVPMDLRLAIWNADGGISRTLKLFGVSTGWSPSESVAKAYKLLLEFASHVLSIPQRFALDFVDGVDLMVCDEGQRTRPTSL